MPVRLAPSVHLARTDRGPHLGGLAHPARFARRVSPLLVAAALVAAACGSSSSSPSASSSVLGRSGSPAATNAGSGSAGGSVIAPASGSAASAAATAAAPSANQASSSAGQGALDLQAQMVAVIKKVNPSVVLIQTSQGLGSGVVFDAQGDIVTNAHVAGSATSFQVSLANGKSYPGTLVGEFAADDIAVVRVKATGLTPAVFGDSSKLQVGDVVLAMGNPLGLQSSVTQGIVSALGRTVSEPTGNALPDTIQTSAPINPGNSGGALVDLAGDVVGIPTLAASDPQMGGAAVGIGFAISSNRARTIATQLIKTGHVTSSGRAFLGIQLADTGGQGVLVYSVQATSPASKAKLAAGDVITAIDGQPTPDTATLAQLLAGYQPGQTVKLDVVHRDGSRATVSVTLGQMPG